MCDVDNFSCGQHVRLSRPDNCHLDGVIQALPGFTEKASVGPLPYYLVLFDCADGHRESLWLTADEMKSNQVQEN